jgi:hypothetical protein
MYFLSSSGWQTRPLELPAGRGGSPYIPQPRAAEPSVSD